MNATLVYDESCGFCTDLAQWAAEKGGYTLRGFEDLTATQEAQLPTPLDECAHIIDGPDVYSCGDAVRYVLGDLSGTTATYHALSLPGVRWVVDNGYRLVAQNRQRVSTLVRSDR